MTGGVGSRLAARLIEQAPALESDGVEAVHGTLTSLGVHTPTGEAARAALAEFDHVHLHEIAKRAGVGRGTLSRNFPNREALLSEVYRRDAEELVAAASALLAEHEPVKALRHWLDRVIDYAEIKRGVLSALEAAALQDHVAHSHNPIEGALGHLLDAGKAAGSIRADVDVHGVLLLIAYLGRLDRMSGDQGRGL